jgi:hypothetical protein
MRKLRLLLLPAIVATVFAVGPGIARADLPTACIYDGSGTPVPCDASWHKTATVEFTIAPAPVPSITGCGTETAPGNGVYDVPAPESANASGTTVSCDDGLLPLGSQTVFVDATPPTSGPPTLPPPSGIAADGTAWYKDPPVVTFPWTDPLSGLSAVCNLTETYSGPPGVGVSVPPAACADVAGNAAPPVAAPPFNFDNVGPVVTGAAATRGSDRNGWYNHPVTWAFGMTDDLSGPAPCDATYSGPDGASVAAVGACADNAGNPASGTSPDFKYDGTPPAVTVTPNRPPDHSGWYNHPVSFSAHGTDATSGVAACSNPTYSGPDSSTASMAGSCTDVAGNTATRSTTFRYDATPPAKAKLFAVPSNKSVDVSWTPPGDGASYALTRAPATGGAAPATVYAGSATHFVDAGLRNGAKYNYLVTVYDAAGNASAPAGISAVPDGSTLRPFIDTAVSNPPLLSWKAVKKASYYNLQLYRGKTKILSVWPKRARLQLGSRWRYNRHRYALTPGLYRWYVWPGIGPTSKHHYGKLLGSSTFRVVG